MKKQINKYSLKKYLEHLKIDIDRKLPCDVVEFSNQEYYSTSKKQYRFRVRLFGNQYI